MGKVRTKYSFVKENFCHVQGHFRFVINPLYEVTTTAYDLLVDAVRITSEPDL